MAIKQYRKIPNKPAHRVWQVTRRAKLKAGYGDSEAYKLVDRKHFSKDTKAGRKRRTERANEIKDIRSKHRRVGLATRGAHSAGGRADETYDNIKKLYRGYGPKAKKAPSRS